MGWFRSDPQRPVPNGVLFTGIAVIWGAPCVAGWMLVAVLLATKSVVAAEMQLTLYGLVYLLIFSPLFSWVGWILAAPLLWFMLRDGGFGWLSAALLGLLIGAIGGSIVGTVAAAPFGLLAILALRWFLGRSLKLKLA
ncbi:hypothetical protein [Pseudorhodobacter sp.]|uniref:hypothetical protein n=1 Tax=Pseudorhodobacter sp. TaxID=1934400 RepID=UPI002649EADD|nr:hypothetical protein [Pseudorhodobacter sp.]MDN5785589.1 hypothetical protein [Pseudorhodobacter sp.]